MQLCASILSNMLGHNAVLCINSNPNSPNLNKDKNQTTMKTNHKCYTQELNPNSNLSHFKTPPNQPIKEPIRVFCLFRGFVKEGRVNMALQLFDKMCQVDFNHLLSLFDVLIKGLCRNNDAHGALSLLLDAQWEKDWASFQMQRRVRIDSTKEDNDNCSFGHKT